MRLKVRRLWRAIKRELPIQFGHEQLTSYGGLELVRRYFQLIGLNARIRRALGKHAGGDYGGSHLVLLVIGLLVVGARRLQHLRYLANDSLFARFCGLSRIPSDRTVVNWLKQFTQTSLRALMRLNSELLYEQIAKLGLRRLTPVWFQDILSQVKAGVKKRLIILVRRVEILDQAQQSCPIQTSEL